ncbi:isoprenylcysteine carboxylmethyltransferase family protein [Paraflavisolibacter sp. H34]|uniref:methyltransferase family protein n=1 Tax=Huijunlia imazamoxiresistens TaxID=3127457 RepID=UPI003016B047
MKGHFPYYRLYYTLFAALTLVPLVVFQARLPSPRLYQPTTLLTLAGGLVLLGGLVLMGVCIRKYFGQLSGLRTLFIDERQTGNHLLLTGVHRYVRHPLYLGTFLALWGAFLLLPYASLLLSNTVITVYTLIGIRLEEAKLLKEFGEPYRRYRQQVPMILPVKGKQDIG